MNKCIEDLNKQKEYLEDRLQFVKNSAERANIYGNITRIRHELEELQNEKSEVKAKTHIDAPAIIDGTMLDRARDFRGSILNSGNVYKNL